jgi:50S ribosomal subunit-associated GTPase HflX
MEGLMKAVETQLSSVWKPRKLTLPAGKESLLKDVYEYALVTDRSHNEEGGTVLSLMATDGNWARIQKKVGSQ